MKKKGIIREWAVRPALLLTGLYIAHFGVVRVLVDLCFAGAGFALGGVLGLGTVICAFLVGPAAQIFLPVSGRLCKFFLHKVGVPAPGEETEP